MTLMSFLLAFAVTGCAPRAPDSPIESKSKSSAPAENSVVFVKGTDEFGAGGLRSAKVDGRDATLLFDDGTEFFISGNSCEWTEFFAEVDSAQGFREFHSVLRKVSPADALSVAGVPKPPKEDGSPFFQVLRAEYR